MPDSNQGYTLQAFLHTGKQASSSEGRELAQSGHRRCKTLVDKVSGTLAVIEMQTLRETLVEVEAKALVDLRFKTRQETLTQV